MKLQEQEFYATRDTVIAKAANEAAHTKLIKALPETNPELDKEFLQALRAAMAGSLFLRHGGPHPLTGRGDINTYAVFAELGFSALIAVGRIGTSLPIGIATDGTMKYDFVTVHSPSDCSRARSRIWRHWRHRDCRRRCDDVLGVEPTNNAAEQALRHAMIWRKLSFGTQSGVGSRFVERSMTSRPKCDVFEWLAAAVQAQLTGIQLRPDSPGRERLRANTAGLVDQVVEMAGICLNTSLEPAANESILANRVFGPQNWIKTKTCMAGIRAAIQQYFTKLTSMLGGKDLR